MSIRQLFTKASCLLGLLALSASMMGCVTGADGIPADGVEAPQPPEPTVTPTETPKATVTPQPTDTSIPLAVVASPTADILPATPTALPTATLTSEQVAANLAELMETNGGCDLPCWWGIVPGMTQLETAREHLVIEGATWHEDNSASFGVEWGVYVQFEVEDTIIESSSIGSGYTPGVIDRFAYTEGWQRYSLAEVLNRYGSPPQVLVYSPFRPDPGGGPSYHLLMFYDNLGFEIEYRGNAEQINGNHYRACPDLADIWDIALFLYRPGQVDNVTERVLPSDSIDYIAGPETVYELISWQEAPGTSLEFFYESYSAPDAAACFEFATPWP